jgi:CDP-diacylglycerol pyrophosphatase
LVADIGPACRRRRTRRLLVHPDRQVRSIKSLSLLALCLATLSLPAKADSDALKKIVIDQCVPHFQARQNPAPCASVDIGGGTALLKDRDGKTQFLLIPTNVVTGIEDRQILAADAPNYFQAAWVGRRQVEELAGKPIPRDDLGLSINSAYGRSQNQLHIHIDCVSPAVKQALHDNDGKIGPHWAPLDVDLVGHRYRAMKIDGDDLGSRNPFKLLVEGDPGAAADMGRETLTVVGAVLSDGKPGFYLLSDRASVMGMDMASSASLLDHDCAVLK